MKKQKIQRLLSVIFTLALILSSCQRFIPNTAPRPSAATETASLPNTGGSPIVVVSDQESDGRTVIIDEVYSNGPGWLAIHNETNGSVGESIGHAAVSDGLNKNVEVDLDPAKATEVMYAMLHIDAGQVGVYEFPGADVPEVGEAQYLYPSFRVTFKQPSNVVPVIDVLDQDINAGTVIISFVISSEPAWVVIYDDHGGKMGDPVGWAAVKAGENLDLVVPVNPNHLSQQMYARLHTDAGVKGTLEFPSSDNPNGADVAITYDGAEVVRPFQNTNPAVAKKPAPEPSSSEPAPTGEANMPMPTPAAGAGMDMHDHVVVTPGSGITPTITVADQDVQDGYVDITEVASIGPGWVAIYTDNDGEPEERIGYTHVDDGVTQNITVQIDITKITPTLHAVLHSDTGTTGDFDFPNADPPVHVNVRMVRNAFSTSPQTAEATPASEPTAVPLSVRVEDQPIRGGTVVVAEVVSDGPGWIGIHLANADGTLSHSAIGAGHLEDGVNRNVIVHLIDPSRATETMFAMLHTDQGIVGQYEFPNPAVDVPVMVDGGELIDTFKVVGGISGQDVNINVAGVDATPFLVDASGYSLYTLSIGECDSECQKDWLPLLFTGKLVAGQGLDQQKLGVVALGGGLRQVTYGNLPLFYYAGDFAPGDKNGHGIDGEWFLVRP